jgi:hypothetical protein
MPGPPVKVRCYVIEEIRSLLTKPDGPRGEMRALGSNPPLFQLPAKKLCLVDPLSENLTSDPTTCSDAQSEVLSSSPLQDLAAEERLSRAIKATKVNDAAVPIYIWDERV